MKADTAVGLSFLFWFVLYLAGVVGYILNIVKIITAWGDPLTTAMIVRLVGVFVAPLGAIAGFF